ncbi:MAG: hypothetical protein RLZZ399_475 [Verrucomicrobiota bacterium]|jgi:hypothetical protein
MEQGERFELKFLLSEAQADAFLSEFGGALQPDTQASPTGSYPVVSLYYDSPDLRCYWDAWHRLPSRHKMRVRVYGSRDGQIPPTTFLELKSKVGLFGIKHRFQTTLPAALAMASGKCGPAEFPEHTQSLLEQVQRMVEQDHFRPSCVVRYFRSAFSLALVPGEPLRVTFDDQIQYRFEQFQPEPDDARFTESLLPKGLRIMEIKGAGDLPESVSRFLETHRLEPSSFSKYCHVMGRKVQPSAQPVA